MRSPPSPGAQVLEDVARRLLRFRERRARRRIGVGANHDATAIMPDWSCPRGPAAMKSVDAEPYSFEFDPAHTALLIIDMQRDFLEPGGFGEMLGNDVAQLRRTIAPNQLLLAAWRGAGLMVMHTREGHRPDLADLPPAKKIRGRGTTCIGDAGPMGRILVRGEPGHDIIPELYPLPDEPVIDKPGKGAFFATDLHAILQNAKIDRLVVTGVTTEVCVNTTVREANDRGYDCFVPADCVGSYFPEFQEMGLKMIKAQGGIFGWVGDSANLIAALKE
jgi:biuret amidohydrolase